MTSSFFIQIIYSYYNFNACYSLFAFLQCFLCREFNQNPNLWETKKKKEKKKEKEKRKKHTPKQKKKKITCIRQYLCGSAICLRPRSCRDFTIIREKYKLRLQCFSLSLGKTDNNKTLIIKLHFLHPAHMIHNGLQNGPISPILRSMD